MATSSPLQERVPQKNTLQRVSDLVILLLLLSLLSYRLASLRRHGLAWLLAFLCESWFAFIWTLFINAKWSPVTHNSYPERLSKRFDDLPAVDMFVTTADPKLEPPVITVNTVLSLLAVEYPVGKLACYVSDDGGSPVTFYSLVEAAKFAKLWVPFCKKYSIRVRAPFVYFAVEPGGSPDFSSDFLKDWKFIKNEYEGLRRRIEDFSLDYVLDQQLNDDQLADFTNLERGNHPSIVKIIWENKELENGFPHLIYVSREKRPKQPHNFKAGAMNVLTRVSGVMTNAPFMLNVDCDMFANNPDIVLHAMCFLLGFDGEASCGYVQSPQRFYGALRDDPFGNQLVVLENGVGQGLAGIQGPFYQGTGCFHRRKAIYGSSPNSGHDTFANEEFEKIFGCSKDLMDSAAQILAAGKTNELSSFDDLSTRIKAAKKVAASDYELKTYWGKEIGWVYGSMTEDVLTGLRIQSMGWKSVRCNPDPPAFLGGAPIGGPASLTQYKRWATGLMEVLFNQNGPVVAAVHKKLEFRQCLGYLVFNFWALRSIFELCYSLLPAYCLLANTCFLPKTSEPGMAIAVLALFLGYYMATLMEYRQCRLSLRAWWNNQRMQRIYALTAWLFALISVLLKILGISPTIFEVTRKDHQQSNDGEDGGEPAGRFTFDSSPVFISGTAVVLANMTALAVGLSRLVMRPGGGGTRAGYGEFVSSAWVLLVLWPFVRGLFEKGSYGIPWPTILKAMALVSLFWQLCK